MPLECSICIEPLHSEPIATTECGHIFHNSCIQEWFRKDHNKCPLCNKKFSHRKPFIPLYIDLRQDNDGNSNSSNYNNNNNSNNNVTQTASEAHLKLKQQHNALLTENTYINRQLQRAQHSYEEVQKQNHLYYTKIRRLRSIQKIVDIEGKFTLPGYQAKLQRWKHLHKEELLDMLFSATFKVDELNKELNRKYDRISQLKERLKLAKERASNSGTRNNRSNAPTTGLSLDEELNNNKRRGKQPVAVLRPDNDSTDDDDTTDDDDQLIIATRSNSVNNQNANDRKRIYASIVENETDEDETDDDTNTYNLRQRGEPNLTRNNLLLNNPLIPSTSASTTPASASASTSTSASTGYHLRKRRQSSYGDEPTSSNNNNNRNGHNVFSTRSRNNWPSRYNHTGNTLKRSRIIPSSAYLFSSNNSNNNNNNDNTRPIVYDLTTDEESNNSNDENENEDFEFERNGNRSVIYNEEREEEEAGEDVYPSPDVEYYRRSASTNPYVIELSSEEEEEEEEEHDHRYAIRV